MEENNSELKNKIADLEAVIKLYQEKIDEANSIILDISHKRDTYKAAFKISVELADCIDKNLKIFNNGFHIESKSWVADKVEEILMVNDQLNPL